MNCRYLPWTQNPKNPRDVAELKFTIHTVIKEYGIYEQCCEENYHWIIIFTRKDRCISQEFSLSMYTKDAISVKMFHFDG